METNNRPIDRIKRFIEFKGLSDSAFEKSVPLSNGYINKLRKGNGSLGSDVLQKIHSKYSDLSLTWVITGIGSMTETPASYTQENKFYSSNVGDSPTDYTHSHYQSTPSTGNNPSQNKPSPSQKPSQKPSIKAFLSNKRVYLETGIEASEIDEDIDIMPQIGLDRFFVDLLRRMISLEGDMSEIKELLKEKNTGKNPKDLL